MRSSIPCVALLAGQASREWGNNRRLLKTEPTSTQKSITSITPSQSPLHWKPMEKLKIVACKRRRIYRPSHSTQLTFICSHTTPSSMRDAYTKSGDTT